VFYKDKHLDYSYDDRPMPHSRISIERADSALSAALELPHA
jgi:hypothetical protein